MKTELAPESTSTHGHDDRTIHSSCECSDDIALCGKDLTDYVLITSRDQIDDVMCVLCDDIQRCPRCGAFLLPDLGVWG